LNLHFVKMSHNVRIELSSDKFYPGGMLTGSATFTLYKDISNVDSMYITVQGNAYAHWTESDNRMSEDTTTSDADGDNTSNDRTYRAKENYFKMKSQLYGNVNHLAQGQHKFPFSFMLPQGVPSSFGFSGHNFTASVEYKLKAKIKRRSSNSNNIQGSAVIYCVGNIPLSACPTPPLAPSFDKDSKYICCFCCKEGPINTEMNLNRTGFVPGEAILININIENLSKTDIRGTRLWLERRVVLKAEQNTKVEDDRIVQLNTEGCRRGDTKSLVNQALQIPLGMAPTDLPYCNIIQVVYKVRAEVVVAGCHTNLQMTAPIFIASFHQPADQPPYAQPAPLVQPMAPYPNQPAPSAPFLPPVLPQPAY